MICSNCFLTVREVEEEVGFSKTMCHGILTENLGMHYVAAQFVSHQLSEDQKQNSVVSKEVVDRGNADVNFLKNIVTVDETWVYAYDVETKDQYSQWVSKMSPRPRKAWQVQSSVKVMAGCFFHCAGIFRHEFLPCGQMVNKEYYLKVMKRLRVRRIRPDLWKGQKCSLHRDNTPVHSSLLICDFLTKHEMTLIPQASVLTRPCTSRILSLHQAEIRAERMTI